VARRVTAADVARAAGVSRATVGFVLNRTPGQTISEPTRDRVLSAAQRLGYRPHRGAQALRRGSSKIILQMLPNLPSGFSIQSFLDEAESRLAESGFTLVSQVHRPEGATRPLWETLDPDVVVSLMPLDQDTAATIRACGVAHILPDPDNREAEERHLRSLWTTGPRMQTDHLHQRGHRVLAFAGSADPRLEMLSTSRRDAAFARAAELGLPQPSAAGWDFGGGIDTVREWVAAGVTGVVAYNDDIAAMVLAAATRAGIRVPGRLAVVGHDDTPVARLTVPELSTVRLDGRRMGREMADHALRLAANRPAPIPDPTPLLTLVHRESS
jgi:DNA-binding LacI/PurR family transcriptional regulator